MRNMGVLIPTLVSVLLLAGCGGGGGGGGGGSAPVQPWATSYGGTEDDYAQSVQRTTDGGYIVAGYTKSFGAGSDDFWVLKLDSDGTPDWQKTYGGAGNDRAYSIQQTSGGGYIVAGFTTSFGVGNGDFWVLKLDGNGGVSWQNAFGGAGADEAKSIQQTSDGGYIVVGYSDSSGAGLADFWVLKLDRDGNIGTPGTWQKTYGGADQDWANSIQQTSDGGYILAGSTVSFGADAIDFWVLKLNYDGTVDWGKRYGGASADYLTSIQQTSDGGYIVTGSTGSFGASLNDFWVLKLDSDGNIGTPGTWQKRYGGTGSDVPYSIRQTSGGGYIVAGYTYSFGAGGDDYWVLKLNSDGEVSWQKRYGGADNDAANSIQTSGGGYIVAGNTASFGAGLADFWVLRLSGDGAIVFNPVIIVQAVDTDAIPAVTNATATDTVATVADTSATITPTDTDVFVTDATVQQQAP